MAETDAVINITANGAESASASLNSVTKGMQGIGAQHTDLVGKFGQRFEHIGLQLFAGEALRASGLGMETRAVVNTLGLALNSLGGMFGAAAVPVMAFGAALAAVIGIYQKIHEHQQKTADSLQKLIDTEEKERGTLEQSIEKLQKYVDTQGPHAAAIERVLEAKRNLQAFTEAVELVNAQKEITALEAVMTAELKDVHALEAQTEATKNLTMAKILHITMTQGLTAGVTAATMKFEDLKGKVEELTKKLFEQNVKLQEHKANVEMMGAGEHQIMNQLLDDWDKQGKASEEVTKKEIDQENQRYQHWAEVHDKQLKSHDELLHKLSTMETQYYSDSDQKILNHLLAQQTASQKMTKELQGMWETAANEIGRAVGNAFAKMIVEGKNFSESMKQAAKDMAESIISDIIRIEIEMRVLNAMGGMGFGPMAFGGFHAEGGSVIVDKPTMFVAGEAGQPEIATFTPLSKLGAGNGAGTALASGGGGVQIGTVQTNVYGVNDPDAIADSVGRKIIERIRGMGEVNFARSA